MAHVLRLRSLQAAMHEDWESVKANADAAEALRLADVPDAVRAAAIATYLLRLYTGLEQLFSRIAEEFNGGAPSGSAWHRELLDLMSRAIPHVRPAVLPKQLKERLDEYWRFRHRITHAYGVSLEWSKMRHLVEQLSGVLSETQASLATFNRFIDELCGES